MKKICRNTRKKSIQMLNSPIIRGKGRPMKFIDQTSKQVLKVI
jgi:hypothetical protein